MKRTIYLLLAAVLTCIQAGAQDFSLSTVVIEAGHGGTDPGAVSRDGKNYEKTFTLDIAQKLSDKIKAECPGVKVILTRDKDKSVALNDRAAIANKAGADLFISIHINSASSTTPNGYSVHVLGKSSNKNRDLFAYNMDVCKRENSVILLEDDYTTTYQGFDPSDPESFIFLQLMQNSNLEQSLAFAELVADNLKGGPISTGRGMGTRSMASGLTGWGFGSDFSAVKREPAIGPGFAKETSLLGFTGRSGITNHSAPDASRLRSCGRTASSRRGRFRL